MATQSQVIGQMADTELIPTHGSGFELRGKLVAWYYNGT